LIKKITIDYDEDRGHVVDINYSMSFSDADYSTIDFERNELEVECLNLN